MTYYNFNNYKILKSFQCINFYQKILKLLVYFCQGNVNLFASLYSHMPQ